jgi:hypothetical protein
MLDESDAEVVEEVVLETVDDNDAEVVEELLFDTVDENDAEVVEELLFDTVDDNDAEVVEELLFDTVDESDVEVVGVDKYVADEEILGVSDLDDISVLVNEEEGLVVRLGQGVLDIE